MDMGSMKSHVLDTSTTADLTDLNSPQVCQLEVAYHAGMKFYNWLDRDVIVRDRLGCPCRVRSLRPLAGQTRDKNYCLSKDMFIVEYFFRVEREDLESVKRYFVSMKNVSAFMSRIADQLVHARPGRDAMIRVITGITTAQFRKGEGRLFFEELGFTMSLEDAPALENPETIDELIKARLNMTAMGMADSQTDAVVVSIEAVDNTGEKLISDRYVSICNRVYRVPVRYDRTSVHHGIIVRSRPSVEDVRRGVPPDRLEVKLLSFEEAEKELGLSKTIEDARSHGDSKLGLEAKLASMQREIKILDQEIADQRRRFEQEALELKIEQERKKQEYEAENAKRAEEKARRDDEAARIKHQRDMDRMDKDNRREQTRGFMDWLRILGSAIGMITALSIGIKRLAG